MSLEKKVIYFVDDEPLVLQLERLLLNGAPFELHFFESGESVIQHLKEENNLPDAVITDISMHEVSGFDLVAFIKKEYPKVKCGYCSAYYSLQDALAAKQITEVSEYHAPYFAKPLKKESLISFINEIL